MKEHRIVKQKVLFFLILRVEFNSVTCRGLEGCQVSDHLLLCHGVKDTTILNWVWCNPQQKPTVSE